jgi:predicted Zn-dependent protease
MTAAGYLSTSASEVAVANTEGVWAYAPSTLAAIETVVTGDAGSAWAERNAMDVGRIDVDEVAREAIEKCAAAQGPRDLAPSTYEVVLEPYAVSDIAAFLGSTLTGQAVEEGRSFVGARLGQKVTGGVTFVDDPFDREMLPRPFDYEGQPSERVTLIEGGVAKALLYDSQTAFRSGAANTGHAVPPNPLYSAVPQHLRIEPGTRTREQLIREVDRGVLVTRFHYTRWVHQLRTIVTGMTRDGTFLIEKGEIAHPVKNFRFTQSYHDALGGTLGIGRDLHLFAADQFVVGGTARRVPALRLAQFAFTGATQY